MELFSPPVLLAIGLALPWLVLPVVAAMRLRGTPSLDDADPVPPSSAPQVSVILPARNEAEHVVECIASLRASTWPAWELIVVNDNSTDDTAALARAATKDDPRVRVLDAPPLPDGWFGKQWACHVAQQAARGERMLFTDADTRHHPELIARLESVRVRRKADLISLSGEQVMVSFWERAVQPVVFALILTRFGGARALERARRPADVVANGQCFLLTRETYDAIGGHAAVRGSVAEDLMIAQRTVLAGRTVSLALGHGFLSTRMYDGLGALVRGWRKNVYAGGRLAMRGGVIGRLLFPVALVGFPLAIALPFVVALVCAIAWALVGSASELTTTGLWALIASAGMLAAFAAAARVSRLPLRRALLAPIGALMFAAICAMAVARGQAVEWKGRAYRSS